MSRPVTRALPGRGKGIEAERDATGGLSQGMLVAGRFQLDELLGEGSMGAVWAASHLVTNRRVAIKVMKAAPSLDLTERFIREARAANAVRHPNVVQVHDVLTLESGAPAMVMDLFYGESLASRLERCSITSLRELAETLLPVVSALIAVHAAGVVHRDLKPDNIFLAQTGNRVEPMILDFGICKLRQSRGIPVESDVYTTLGRIMGTPSYMAPEQLRSAAEVDARADVWALGIIFYECVSGQPPWRGESLPQIVGAIALGPPLDVRHAAPHLPAELASVINRMLAREPAERLADLREVLAVLQQFSASTASAQERPSSRDTDTLVRGKLQRARAAVRWALDAQRGRGARAAALIAVMAGAGLLAGFALRSALRVTAQRTTATVAHLGAPTSTTLARPPAPIPASVPLPMASARLEGAHESPEQQRLVAPQKPRTLRAVPAAKRSKIAITDFGGRR